MTNLCRQTATSDTGDTRHPSAGSQAVARMRPVRCVNQGTSQSTTSTHRTAVTHQHAPLGLDHLLTCLPVTFPPSSCPRTSTPRCTHVASMTGPPHSPPLPCSLSSLGLHGERCLALNASFLHCLPHRLLHCLPLHASVARDPCLSCAVSAAPSAYLSTLYTLPPPLPTPPPPLKTHSHPRLDTPCRQRGQA